LLARLAALVPPPRYRLVYFFTTSFLPQRGATRLRHSRSSQTGTDTARFDGRAPAPT
jgi:hypothetical protein